MSDLMTLHFECILKGIYSPLLLGSRRTAVPDGKRQCWVFSLVNLTLFFFQVISPRRATRRKDPNFYELTYLTHQVMHITYFTKQQTVFVVLRLHLSFCVCCRGRAPHPCHTVFIVFLILPLPTPTVHWHKR